MFVMPVCLHVKKRPPDLITDSCEATIWWLGIELRTLGKGSHLSSLYIINLIRRGAGEVAQQ